MVYCTAFYRGFVLAVLSIPHHITAVHARTHTHTHARAHAQPYEFQPCNSMCHLSLAHAEYVMREAWVRLGQILDFTGVLMWLWAWVLQWNTLQFFCWTTRWPAGPKPHSRVICHHATANVFRGRDVLFFNLFLLTWRMRRRTEDILEEGVFYFLDVGWSRMERVEGGAISRNRKAERREKKIK